MYPPWRELKFILCRVYGITGGGGFLGYRLALMLLADYNDVFIKLLDIREPNISLHTTSPYFSVDTTDKVQFIKCDLRDSDQVDRAIEGCTVVIHAGSYGMSGREMANPKMIDLVNINGTQNVIQACIKHKFCGQTIVAGTEATCKYVPASKHLDRYSYTKCEAEKMILKANNDKLKTCAIRPAAIYGDGEERHTLRILDLINKGLGVAAIGNVKILCDWVFVDNLAHGLILADKKLAATHTGSALDVGEAYFISDDDPINNFAFLTKLIRPLGYHNIFLFYIPTFLFFYLAYILEFFQRLCAPFFFFAPMMNRAEVVKVGVTHYMNIAKAKKELLYSPVVTPGNAIRRCSKWYSDNGHKKMDGTFSGTKVLFALLLVCVFLVYHYEF